MKDLEYSKINVEEIVKEIGTDSWEALRDIINFKTGFVLADERELKVLRERYRNTSLKLDKLPSFKNILYAAEYYVEGKFEEVRDLEIDVENCYVIVNGIKKPYSAIRMKFKCPSCSILYKREGNPARFLMFKSSLCKTCQKKQLHSCDDVKFNYENAMLQTYGVKYPIQKGELKSKIKSTMRKRYGTDWAMQSSSVKEKHADNMMKKYGYRNYFCKENINFIPTHHFYSHQEEAVARYIEELLPNEKIYSCLNHQKFVKIPDGMLAPDVYIPRLNLIFEYYGDYWHAHESINRELFSSFRTREEVHRDDEKRIKTLQNVLSADAHVVWEHDWLADEQKQKKRVRKIIYDRKKDL